MDASLNNSDEESASAEDDSRVGAREATDFLSEVHSSIIDGDLNRLEDVCNSADLDLNEKFTEQIDPQHANMTPLALACALNKLTVVKFFLENYASAPDYVNNVNSDCVNNEVNSVNNLNSDNVNNAVKNVVNKVNLDNANAVVNEANVVVHKVNVNEKFASLQTTALMTSAFHGNPQILKLLLDHGADPKMCDVQGSTALGYCFGGSRSFEVVSMLLDAGVDVNCRNVLGMNALLLVSGYGNESLLQMVLEAGAETCGVYNNYGHSPLHLAVLGKQSQVNRIVREKGRTSLYGLDRRDLKQSLSDWITDNETLMKGHTPSKKAIDSACKLITDIEEKLQMRLVTSSPPLDQNRSALDDVTGNVDSQDGGIKRKMAAVDRLRAEKLATKTETDKNSAHQTVSGIMDSLLSCGGRVRKLRTNKSKEEKPTKGQSKSSSFKAPLTKLASFSPANILKKIPPHPPYPPTNNSPTTNEDNEASTIPPSTTISRPAATIIRDWDHDRISREADEKVAKISDSFAKVVRELLERKCETEVSEFVYGLTPLDAAILNGDLETVALLLGNGCDPEHLYQNSALRELYGCLVSSQKADRLRMKELLKWDEALKINQSFQTVHCSKKLSATEKEAIISGDEGLTPLAVAAKQPDSIELCKLLIKHGADINGVGKGGTSAFGEACRRSNIKIVEYLLSQGADIEQENPAFKNATPISMATLSKQHRVAELLIQKDAKVGRLMSDQRTCLIAAMDHSDMPMIDILLQANLDRNFVDKRGFFYKMAEKYKMADKDIGKILQSISKEAVELKEREKNSADLADSDRIKLAVAKDGIKKKDTEKTRSTDSTLELTSPSEFNSPIRNELNTTSNPKDNITSSRTTKSNPNANENTDTPENPLSLSNNPTGLPLPQKQKIRKKSQKKIKQKVAEPPSSLSQSPTTTTNAYGVTNADLDEEEHFVKVDEISLMEYIGKEIDAIRFGKNSLESNLHAGTLVIKDDGKMPVQSIDGVLSTGRTNHDGVSTKKGKKTNYNKKKKKDLYSTSDIIFDTEYSPVDVEGGGRRLYSGGSIETLSSRPIPEKRSTYIAKVTEEEVEANNYNNKACDTIKGEIVTTDHEYGDRRAGVKKNVVDLLIKDETNNNDDNSEEYSTEPEPGTEKDNDNNGRKIIIFPRMTEKAQEGGIPTIVNHDMLLLGKKKSRKFSDESSQDRSSEMDHVFHDPRISELAKVTDVYAKGGKIREYKVGHSFDSDNNNNNIHNNINNNNYNNINNNHNHRNVKSSYTVVKKTAENVQSVQSIV